VRRIQLSACAILDNGKLLLIWKNKQSHYEFPGGKVEIGETLEQTAIRETKEEIGCDVKIIKYVGYSDFSIEERNFRSHKYLAQISMGQSPMIMEPAVFRDFLWLPMRHYKEYSVAPNVKDFCEDYIKGKLDI